MKENDLKKAGLRVTVPRLKILQILASAQERHLSAEQVLHVLSDGGENIGLATVYRVLTQLEEAGLVARHHFEGEHAVFELADVDHHDHLVCVKCGRVEEFTDDVIEKRQQEVAERAEFSMIDHSLNIYGVCRGCQPLGK